MGGTGATLGTNDWLTLVRDGLATQYPTATITQSNRAQSGSTVATNQINNYFPQAVTDNGDLYLIAFGKNDTVADPYAEPVPGYPVANSMKGLELMIRRIRRRVPQADIMVISQNPNIAADTSGNSYLQAWNARAKAVAGAYGCEWVDGYAAFTALGNYSSYLSDSVHPSTTGHALLASTTLAHFPAAYAGSIEAPGRPSIEGGIYSVANVSDETGYNGWVVRQSTGAVHNGMWNNTGTWTGPNPYQTTTANDYAEFRFVGSELMVRFSTASGDAAVVDITVDGVVTQSNLALTTIPSAYTPFLLVASGLSDTSRHTVKITLKSGTLKIYQAAWLSGRVPIVEPSTPRTYISGRYYGQDPYYASTNNPALGTGLVTPFYVSTLRSFTRIGVEVVNAQASTTINLGIYGSDQDGQPWGLIADYGTVSPDTTGFKEITISELLTPGWYWLAYLATGATAPSVRVNYMSLPLVSSTSTSIVNPFNAYGATGLSALPSIWTGTTAYGSAPRIMLKAS